MTLTAALPGFRKTDWCSLMPRKPFGRYLREKRIAVDLTQETLAKAWGKSQTTVSDIERTAGTDDEVIPKRKDIASLAAVLRRPVDEVYRAAGYAVDEAEELERVIEDDDGLRAIVDTYSSTSPVNREILRAMAEKMRELDREHSIGGGAAPDEREN